jgi:hypothetical protein
MGGIMIGTFDYRERISECQQWAEKAANDQAKLLWKEMERFWRERSIVAHLRSETSSDRPLQS